MGNDSHNVTSNGDAREEEASLRLVGIEGDVSFLRSDVRALRDDVKFLLDLLRPGHYAQPPPFITANGEQDQSVRAKVERIAEDVEKTKNEVKNVREDVRAIREMVSSVPPQYVGGYLRIDGPSVMIMKVITYAIGTNKPREWSFNITIREDLPDMWANMFRKMVPFVDTATWNSTIPEWGRVNMLLPKSAHLHLMLPGLKRIPIPVEKDEVVAMPGMILTMFPTATSTQTLKDVMGIVIGRMDMAGQLREELCRHHNIYRGDKQPQLLGYELRLSGNLARR
ncbi:hypothetical protein BT69DRAFT_1277868 [Atractiella rhizophila]|nr:hypothetical protein BT69DRAFT_1277868 [Atractiella rhizophila]